MEEVKVGPDVNPTHPHTAIKLTNFWELLSVRRTSIIYHFFCETPFGRNRMEQMNFGVPLAQCIHIRNKNVS
jgi:hypothetical protein